MVVMGNSQEYDVVLSVAAFKALLLSSSFLVQKETPRFYLHPLARRQVSGSARRMPMCVIPALDWAETPEFEGRAAKFDNPKVDWKETPEFEDPWWTEHMLSGPSGRADKYANLVGDPTWTPEFDVVGFDKYLPRARPMYSGPAFKAAKFGNPKVDWKETPEFYLFEVDLPGLKKEQVKLEVEKGRTLRISGKWSTGKLEEDKNYTRHFNERSSGEFHRCFLLPENAKLDHIKATIGNGVLTVTVPKEEAKIIKIGQVKTIKRE